MQRGEQTRDDEEWMFVRKLFSRMIFSVFISLSSEHCRPVQSETFRQLPTPSNLLPLFIDLSYSSSSQTSSLNVDKESRRHLFDNRRIDLIDCTNRTSTVHHFMMDFTDLLSSIEMQTLVNDIDWFHRTHHLLLCFRLLYQIGDFEAGDGLDYFRQQ